MFRRDKYAPKTVVLGPAGSQVNDRQDNGQGPVQTTESRRCGIGRVDAVSSRKNLLATAAQPFNPDARNHPAEDLMAVRAAVHKTRTLARQKVMASRVQVTHPLLENYPENGCGQRP